eukprot:jgi/Hompol1/1961/HPOL_005797-RA
MLFTPTSFPSIIPMLNCREDAFEVLVDESSLARNFGSTTGLGRIQENNPPDAELYKFWIQLRNARLEDDMLTLPPGVYFLGDPSLGSSLFVRHCFKEIALGIEQSLHWQRGMVITGTPGMGKTFFGLWMLYLIATEVIQLPGEELSMLNENLPDMDSLRNPDTFASRPIPLGESESHEEGLFKSTSEGGSHFWMSPAQNGLGDSYTGRTDPSGTSSNDLSRSVNESLDKMAFANMHKPVIIWDSHTRNELIIFSVADGTVTTGWSRRSSHPAFYHPHVWYISDGDLPPLTIPSPTVGTSNQINIRKTLHLT